jgi:hypothetical protein
MFMKKTKLALSGILAFAACGCASEGDQPPDPAVAEPAAPPPATQAPPPETTYGAPPPVTQIHVAPAGARFSPPLTVAPNSIEVVGSQPAGNLAAAKASRPVAVSGPRGQIKVCKLGTSGAGDSVYVPADGTYGGGCGPGGDQCRAIEVVVTRGARLAPGAGTCATLDAVLVQGDGQPLVAGESLIANWSTGDFIPAIRVTRTFK